LRDKFCGARNVILFCLRQPPWTLLALINHRRSWWYFFVYPKLALTPSTSDMQIVLLRSMLGDTDVMHLRRQYDPTYQPTGYALTDSQSHGSFPPGGEPLIYSLSSLLLWCMLLVLKRCTTIARLNVESSSQLDSSLRFAAWYVVPSTRHSELIIM